MPKFVVKNKEEAEPNYYYEIIFEKKLSDEDGDTEMEIVDKQFKSKYEAMGYVKENHQDELDRVDYRIVINSVINKSDGTQVKEKSWYVKDYDEPYYQYTFAGTQFEYKRIITVAGGGLMCGFNGNSYATVEVIYHTAEDMENDAIAIIEYCEYGENPTREHLGNAIEFSPDGNSFRVYQS